MPESTSNCTYTLIDNNVHHVVLHTSTRQTVEDLFLIIDQTVAELPANQRGYYLIDATDCGDLPYRYLAQRSQQWTKSNPDSPSSRLAILYNMNLVASMINVLSQQFTSKKTQIRLFAPKESDAAMQWLLE